VDYTFQFEALLSYRRHLKERAELDFSKSLQSLTQARELMQIRKQALLIEKTDFESNLKKGMQTEKLLTHFEFLSELEKKSRNQAREVSKLEAEVDKSRTHLLKETTQYRVIEKLKEKDYEKWKNQQLQLEQKRMDELTVVRFGRDFP
jgi:flagellar FliJ protein